MAARRAITIRTKGLRELQKAMKQMETAVEPKDVNPILAYALEPMRDKALDLLRRLTKRRQNLPAGWEHIEDALTVKEGKSEKVARAFAKVFRKASPQAVWIEFGHKQVGHKPHKKDTGKFVTANPFFRPALDMTRPEIRKRINDGLKDLLQRSADNAGFPKA